MMVPTAHVAAAGALVEQAASTLQQRHVVHADAARQAEEFLMSFRAAPRPYALCWYLLAEAHAEAALFEAVTTLRLAALREWSTLPAAFATQLPFRLLQLVVQGRTVATNQLQAHVDSAPPASPSLTGLSPVVRRQCLVAAAVLVKRTWVAQEESTPTKERRVPPVGEMLLQHLGLTHDAPGVIASVGLLRHCLEEFACASCSAIGVSWSAHKRAHCSFETMLLPPLFVRIVSLVRGAHSQWRRSGDASSVTLLLQALHGVVQILDWDFARPFPVHAEPSSAWSMRVLHQSRFSQEEEGAVSSGHLPAPVRPGSTWATLLIHSELLTMILAVYVDAVQHRQQLQVEDVVKACIDVVTRLGCLSGGVFRAAAAPLRKTLREEKTECLTTRASFLTRLVRDALPRMARDILNPDLQLLACRHDDDRVISVCRLFACVASGFGIKSLLLVTKASADSFLVVLTRLLMAVLRSSASSDEGECEASHLLITAVGFLLSELEMERYNRQASPERRAHCEVLTATMATTCRDVFRVFCEQRLMRARQEALGTSTLGTSTPTSNFVDDPFDDDTVVAVAALARIDVRESLNVLINALHTRVQQFVGILGGHATDASVLAILHEELYTLLFIIGHVVADPATAGETPLIPDPFMDLSCNTPLSENEPLLTCVAPVFTIVEAVVRHVEARAAHQQSKGALLSPFVARTLVWFLARWSASYLMPNEALYGRVSERYVQLCGAEGTESSRILGSIVHVTQVFLLHWSEDGDLAEATCDLVHRLVRNAKVRPRIGQCAGWAQVLQSYQQLALVDGSDPQTNGTFQSFAQLPPPVLGRLVQSLCQAAASTDESQRAAAFSFIFAPIESRLKALLALPNFAVASQQPRIVQAVFVTVHLMRGVARASGARCFDRAFAFLSCYFEALVQLVRVYAAYPFVVDAVLKIFRDIAEGEMPYLSADMSRIFMHACLSLVRQYCEANAERLKEQQSVRVFDTSCAQGTEDRMEDVCTLLRLVSAINDKDAFDLSNDVVNFGSDAALLCVLTMMPLLDGEPDVLLFPDVVTGFFSLLQDLVTTHPDKFAALAKEMRVRMCTAVRFAITQPVPSVMRSGLQALAAMASFAVRRGPGVTQEDLELLVPFVTLLLEQLVYASLPYRVVEHAADALLPLLILTKDKYASLCNAFVESWRQRQQVRAERLAAAQRDPGTNREALLWLALPRAEMSAPQCSKQVSILQGAFAALAKGNGVSGELTRGNRAAFRRNVIAFVDSTKSIVSR